MFLNNYFPCFTSTFKNFKSNKKRQLFENNMEFQNVLMNLINQALYLFEWNNLPNTCNAFYMEQALLFNGKVALVYDDNLGYLTLACNPKSVFNIYGEYDRVQVIGNNSYQKEFDLYLTGADNSKVKAVLCKDNYMMYPIFTYLVKDAERISNALMGIDVCRNGLKRPYVFVTNDPVQRKYLQDLMSDLSNNSPAIITSKFDIKDTMLVLPTNTPTDVINTLWADYQNLLSQSKSRLGIKYNPQNDKKERLLVDEVNADDDASELSLLTRYQTRVDFCNQVNEVFGLNISCDIRQELKEMYENEPIFDDVIKDEVTTDVLQPML